MSDTIKVLKIIIDTLSELKDKEINDLINKKAILRVEYKQEGIKKEIKDANIDEVCKKLESLESREEATEFLKGLKFKKEILKVVAKKYSIGYSSKDTNNLLIEKIVEGIVGSKLRFNMLLNTKI